MRLRSRQLVLACIAGMSACAGAPPALAAGAPGGPLAPPAIPRSAHVVGALPASTPLSLTVALAPRDPAALAAYAAGVSDPASPDYRHYLTVSKFAARFGASQSSIDEVTGALRARGLDPGPVAANGLSLAVSAPASTVAAGLSTSFERVALPGRTAYVNTAAPSLGSASGDVQGIIGLDDLAVARPLGLTGVAGQAPSGVFSPTLSAGPHAVPHTTPSGGPSPCSTATMAAGPTGSAPGTYTMDELASAYSFGGLYGNGDLGAGQTVAVYELEGNIPSDITAFESCYGITTNVSYQRIDGVSGVADPSQGQGVESELDIETVIGLAPATNVAVYQGPNSGNGPYDTYNAIISGDHAKVITTSWGQCEPELGSAIAAAESTLFQEAAAQGQTIVAASGDSGSEDCYFPPIVNNTSDAVDDPASQPFVTGVGGTSLPSLTHAQPEVVWNDQGTRLPEASGGGNSTLWGMPSFQLDANPTLGVINANSATTGCGAATGDCREVPDVSADADPQTGYLIYYDGDGLATDTVAWQGAGGTSAAAPLWAALFALADASPSCSTGSIGFANPALYGAAGSAAGSTLLNDVTSGTNDWLNPASGIYSAKPGYDQATGLGTPVGSALVPAVCGGPITLKSPGAQTTIAGSAASLQMSASTASGAITYGASGLPPGLSINASSGLISGTATTAGSYAVTVSATTPEQAVYVPFQWTVSNAVVTLVPVASQRGVIRLPASVQLSASSNNGSAVTYAATGLPAGMSLDPRTGLISGRPSAAGTRDVTISAAAAGAATAVQSFTWVIVGPPTVGKASLSGVRGGAPTLSLSLTAGVDAGLLSQISFSLPKGLSFVTAKLSKGISATGGSIGTYILRGHLTITLRPTRQTLVLKVRSHALKASGSLRTSVKKHRARPLSFSVQVLDSLAVQTTLPVSVKPS